MKILKLGLVYKASGKASFCALKYVMLVTEFVCSTFPSFFSFACSMQGKLWKRTEWELVEFGEL
jgi:hypothetical protein